jgi:hypothetical protein
MKHEFTKEEAKEFLRGVYGRPTLEIKDEKEVSQLMLLFAMMDPISTSNNQHSWCDVYLLGETRYEVTTFEGDEVVIHRSCTWEEMGL